LPFLLSLNVLVTKYRFEIIDKTECDKRQNLIVNRDTMRQNETNISINEIIILQCRPNHDDIWVKYAIVDIKTSILRHDKTECDKRQYLIVNRKKCCFMSTIANLTQISFSFCRHYKIFIALIDIFYSSWRIVSRLTTKFCRFSKSVLSIILNLFCVTKKLSDTRNVFRQSDNRYDNKLKSIWSLKLKLL
jgi:hypothetical protein